MVRFKAFSNTFLSYRTLKYVFFKIWLKFFKILSHLKWCGSAGNFLYGIFRKSDAIPCCFIKFAFLRNKITLKKSFIPQTITLIKYKKGYHSVTFILLVLYRNYDFFCLETKCIFLHVCTDTFFFRAISTLSKFSDSI